MDNLNFNSSECASANKIFKWFNTDTEELYLKNLAVRHSLLSSNGWIGSSFTYKINSKGFRCDEFLGEDNIMIVGCSNTFGVGLPLANTWAQIVARQVNLRCANLAQPAAGLDTAFRLGLGWIAKLKPKIVVLCCPPLGRFEYVTKEEVNLLGWWSQKTPGPLAVYYKTMVIDENNIGLNAQKNILALEQLSYQHNAKFISVHFNDIRSSDPYSFARDLIHPGVNANKIFAQKLINIIS